MKYAQKASSRFSLKISQSQPLKIFCMYAWHHHIQDRLMISWYPRIADEGCVLI